MPGGEKRTNSSSVRKPQQNQRFVVAQADPIGADQVGAGHAPRRDAFLAEGIEIVPDGTTFRLDKLMHDEPGRNLLRMQSRHIGCINS